MATKIQDNYSFATNPTSRTIVFDSEPTEGNLLLFIVHLGNALVDATRTMGIPAGAQAVVGGDFTGTFGYGVFLKRVSSSETNAYTFSVAVGTPFSVYAEELSGGFSETLPNNIGASSTAYVENSDAITLPAIATAAGERLYASVYSRYSAELSGFSNDFTGTALEVGRVSLGTKIAAGATEGTTATVLTIPANQRFRGVLFSLVEGVPTGPVIESVAPGTITPNSTPVIDGAGFGAAPSAVLLSPTNDRTDVNAVAQTIGAGAGNTSIPLTGVALPAGTTGGATLYYFVQAQDLTWSAGYPVTFSAQPTLSVPEVFNSTLDGFSFRFTTDTGNGTAIWAAYATAAERNSASVENIQAEIATPVTSLARGQFTVTTTGVQTVSAITGLGAAQTRYVRVFHDGDVTA